MTFASTSSSSGLSATYSIQTLYSDGGVVEVNPSPIAGVWAWCATDARDWRRIEEGGFLLTDAEHALWSNNQLEWYAALQALEAMPDGWSGMLVTDSKNVLARLEYLRRNLGDRQALVPRNLPWQWYRRMVTALLRLDTVAFRHVKGHPTALDLRLGHTAEGHAVSAQQVWCDMRCGQESVKARLLHGQRERVR